MSRLKELQKLIDRADDAYYTSGKAIMEDAKYDQLIAELRSLSPNDPRLLKVGAKVRGDILKSREHTIPMTSLDKALNKAEFYEWVHNNHLEDEHFHASLKMDGGSVSLEFEGGRLVRAISRGDGLVGEDITANALNFKNVPPVVGTDDAPFTGFVRGEIVLEMAEWEEVDPDKTTNPRNTAVGIARRKDGTQSELLKFYAFRGYNTDGEPLCQTEYTSSLQLKALGFDVAPFFGGNDDEVWDWFEKQAKIRPTLPYWIDGVVVKINDIEKQLSLPDKSDGIPGGQIAIKFEPEGAISKLLGVHLQVGQTGAITPVADFEPVRIGGATITNANLCNWENIEELGVAIGDKVRVIKSGDIIPRIMEVVEKGKRRKTIKKPTECPVCTGKTGHKETVFGADSAAIYCLNNKCPAIIFGKIDKFVSSLDIKGISTGVINALIKIGVTKPADLYTLTDRAHELANLRMDSGVRFGETRAQKLIDEIEGKRELTLSELLGSLGVFGLGKRRVTLIQERCPGKFKELNDWLGNNLLEYAYEAGIPNIAKRIHAELKERKPELRQFLANGVAVVAEKKKKQAKEGAPVICITGTLSSPKSHYEALCEKAGYGYTNNFSSAVTHLVAADPNSGSGKLKKAAKAGIKVISEEELIKLLGAHAQKQKSVAELL